MNTGDGLGGRRDDHDPHPDDVQEARRAEAGGDAGRRAVGAAAAGRQRHGQGAGAGVPVAADAGRGRVRDDRGAGRGARGVNRGYVSRVLRLTLLAPDIVEAILDGRQPEELQLDDLLEGFPLEWITQAGNDQSSPKGQADQEPGRDWGARHLERVSLFVLDQGFAADRRRASG